MSGPGREINAALLALLVITTLSGVAAFGTGTEGPAGVLVAVHGAAGIGLLLLAPAKAAIARRGLRRPGRSRKVISWALVVLVLTAVASGFLHALDGFRGHLGLRPMQIHVGAAVAALGVPGGHLWTHRRRVPVRRTDLDRRVALRGAGLGLGAAALWLVAPGRERRPTGSHEVGSGEPAAMPVTQWMFDPVPRIAPSGGCAPRRACSTSPRWRRCRSAPSGPSSTAPAAGGPSRSAAVRSGVGDGRAVEVVSATGYRRRLPARDAGALLLATHAGGRPLSAGHGGPARLVAPGRRGFWWVTWVVAVVAVDEPWWWQPFPL